jgi:HAMP domain-containing protein
VPALRPPRWLSRKPRRPAWHAILTLQRARRAQLRTRVLAGVLAVTVIALVAFDFAAVGALRRYLLGHTDAQLQSVLGLYRPMAIAQSRNTNWAIDRRSVSAGGQRRPPPGMRLSAGGPRVQQVPAGPRLKVPAPILAQFGVGFVSGQGPRELISGNPDLVPRIPSAQLRRVLAASRGPQTLISADGGAALRLGAIHEPGGFLYATTSLSDLNSTMDHLELILAIASVAVGLLVAGGIGLVLRRGLRPIERMAGQADKITAGDLTERVRPQDPGTEVGLFRRAIDNLLANVRAHTPRHTTATLTATRANDSITIEVSDDGPGVPPAQLARIFDRFYRGGPGGNCPPGAGLGLAIVNAVAATHHGTAQASLNDPHGLRIRLTLPASHPADQAAPALHTVSAPT